MVGSGTLRGAPRAGPTLDGADAGKTDDDPLRQSTLDGDDEEAPDEAQAALRFERGATIDRYIIIDRIGAGAMGVVYTAYDPRLDRRIALKVMHAKPGAQATDVVARVLREAQALARLQHPNVVTVYDANALGEIVYLTMELVDGASLTRWLKVAPRSIAEVLEVFVAAGRGLAAAHAVGLIHRDFKPDNVLVGNDGRVRVVDFGIARGADGPDLLTVVAALERSGRSAGTSQQAPIPTLTTAAPPAGESRTPPPRAMVAELSPGAEPPNLPYASTDRGTVPAWARTQDLADTQRAGADGVVATNDRARVLSSQLETAIPGLSSVRLTRTGALVGTPAYMAPEQHIAARVDARADQFAFCVALYEALYGTHPFPAKNYVQLSLSVLGGKVDPMLARTDVPVRVRKSILRGLRVDPGDRFVSMDELLTALTYDPMLRRRRRVGVAFISAGAAALLAFAGLEVFGGTPPCEGVERRLDGIYDANVQEEIRAAFLATNQPFAAKVLESSLVGLGKWSGEWAAMRREACEATHVHHEQSLDLLDRRMACLGRQLRGLAATTAVFRAADKDAVVHAVEAVDALPDLTECADVELLKRTDAPSGEQVAEIAAIEDLLARADASLTAVHYAEAEQLAGGALARARSLGLARVESRGLIVQGRVQKSLARYSGAEQQFTAAAALAEKIGADDVRAEAWGELGLLLGGTLRQGGEAERLLRHTQVLLERIGGTRPQRIRLAEQLASVLFFNHRLDEALALLDEAMAGAEALFGRSSTRLITLLNVRGNVHDLRGEPTRALADYGRALEISEEHLGSDHPNVAQILQNIAGVEMKLDRLGPARARIERALAIAERSLGERHPAVANVRLALGNLLFRSEDYDSAAAEYEKSLAVLQGAGGADGDVADALYSLAIAYHLRGEYERALKPYREALVRSEKLHGSEHPEVALPLVGMGAALVELGRMAEAVPLLERALTICTRQTVEDVDLGEIRFALSRAVATGDRGLAHDLATQARQDYADAGNADQVAAIDKWLATITPRHSPRK